MASKNVSAIKAALNDCTTLTGCIEIPEELFSEVYSRLIDLSWQDIEVEVSGITSLSLTLRFMIHKSVSTKFFFFRSVLFVCLVAYRSKRDGSSDLTACGY